MEGADSRRGSVDQHGGSNKSLPGIPEPSFLSDFILVSEFSELEGPVPLFIVPEGAQGMLLSLHFILVRNKIWELFGDRTI